MKFSIITPTYNRAHLIKRAINSVIMQDYNNWEMIVIDDGSIDNTKEVVESIHDNIIYYKLNKNLGVNVARNYGIKKATGEWILFLDSDDILYSKNTLSRLSTILIKNLGYLVYCFPIYKIFDNNKKIKGEYKIRQNQTKSLILYEDLVLKKNIAGGDLFFCIHKSIFKNKLFPEFINGFESLFFNNIAKKNSILYYDYITVMHYMNKNEDHLSNNAYLIQPDAFLRAYQIYIADHINVLKHNKQKLFHYCLRIIKLSWLTKKYLKFIIFFFLLIFFCPSYLIKYIYRKLYFFIKIKIN